MGIERSEVRDQYQTPHLEEHSHISHISCASTTHTLDSGHDFLISVDTLKYQIVYGTILSPRKGFAIDSISGMSHCKFYLSVL